MLTAVTDEKKKIGFGHKFLPFILVFWVINTIQ